MKRNKTVHRAGPYRVISISQDGQGVRLEVFPSWPEYEDGWVKSRANGEGGGPGIFTCMRLAKEMERFLNQDY